MTLKATITAAIAGTMMLAPPAHADVGDTLKTVKERGSLSCTGHNGSYLGMAEVDDKGNWTGLDIDLCKSLATAIFGTEESHLTIQPTSWAQRWPSIQSGELDIIIKASGWTMGRDTDVSMQFSRPYMLAAIHLMTHKNTGAKIASDLDGGTLCVQTGTTLERNAVEHASANGYELEVISFEKTEEAKAAFLSGRCDAYVDWDLQLGVLRATEADNPQDYIILPDMLSAEPVAIVMRQGDDQWVDIANWMVSALLMAEENGVTSANVDEMLANPPTPGIAKLLGVTPGVGERLGLEDDWAYNVIKRHGNFDEIWQRNVGTGSVYGVARGVNALIRDGGIMHSLVMD
jgi:general L-amino acid transport system substrate-binding protein